MGMFDTIKCFIPLPCPDVEYQSKSLDCMLDEYIIGSDGSFSNPHYFGDLVFYKGVNTVGGKHEWFEFRARVDNGSVLEITQTSPTPITTVYMRSAKKRHSSEGDQPLPAHNDRAAVWDLVKADIDSRDNLGRLRYGTRLQPFNGRDTVRDTYEEALDKLVYLRSLLVETQELRADLNSLAEANPQIKDAITALIAKYTILAQ